jgi:hypothetical protein
MFHLSAAIESAIKNTLFFNGYTTGQNGDFSAEMHELVLSYPAWGNFSQLRFTCSNNTVQ